MTVARGAAQSARRSRLATPFDAQCYDRPTELVSRDLLGAVLECRTKEGVTRGRIVETEAYLGPDDPACHATAGLTKRTEHLFGPPGTSYVYLIYGMYWCFNAVTREHGHGAAVLIRAVAPLDGIDLMRRRRPNVKSERELTNGPGKLCLAMGIVGAMSGTSLRDGPIVIRPGESVRDADVVVTPRIGITRAAAWPLRYLVRDDPFVSATPKHFPRQTYGE
jgi:DNA-3-methyladenine glycosylase